MTIQLSDHAALVVDDMHSMRTLVTHMLREADIAMVWTAGNGQEAVAKLMGEAADATLIVTDINMPTMNGLELLKAVRMGVAGVRRDLPVAMFTGESESRFIARALRLDVGAYLVKPASQINLISRVGAMLAQDCDSTQWLKPVPVYARVPIADAPPPPPPPPPEPPQRPGKITVVALDAVMPGTVLAAPLISRQGEMLFDAPYILTDRDITRLKQMCELGESFERIEIVSHH